MQSGGREDLSIAVWLRLVSLEGGVGGSAESAAGRQEAGGKLGETAGHGCAKEW